ncbi:MAG: methyltransferase domain-containing protein [Verrucomicrobiota bacterium]
MRRDFDPDELELMDLPNPDPKDLEDDLTNLGIINRWFGGTKNMLAALGRLVAGAETFTVVDLATGYGDHPRNMVKWARGQGKRCQVMAVDNQMDTLVMAREASRATPEVAFIQADIRKLPFKDKATDFTFCCLALHHFSETDVVKVLRESRRIARRGTAAMDLRRSRLAFLAVWLLTEFILRARMTKHDARMSIRRAFTGQELKILAHQGDWTNYEHSVLPWFQQEIRARIPS